MPDKIYKCPTCNSVVDESHYLKIMGLLKSNKKKEHESYLKGKTEGKEIGIKEQSLALDRVTNLYNKLLKENEIQNTGRTHQDAGRDYEVELTNQLRIDYPSDSIEHHGKVGDILHIVYLNNTQIGKIVYECKQEPTLKEDHIKQTYTAKLKRKADFGVLVTTGKRKRKSFDGFSHENDIFITTPSSVIFFIPLLRNLIISNYRSNMTIEEKNSMNNILVQYITQGDGKLSINSIIKESESSWNILLNDIKQSRYSWDERRKSIIRIGINALSLGSNINSISSNGRVMPLKIDDNILKLPVSFKESTDVDKFLLLTSNNELNRDK
jgi:hypothetical protein